MISINAMILAAGLGVRLRPYSLARPKPLFPVLGRPLLALILKQLCRAFPCTEMSDNRGTRSIVVNAFHLRDQIADFLRGQANIRVQMEDRELGTGGGLRLAMHGFVNGPVLVTNGDIYHNIDYSQVYEHHIASGHPVTLVLHDCPRFNNVSVTEEGRILGFGSALRDGAGRHKHSDEVKELAFTGIHVINPEILEQIPLGSFYNIIDRYRALISRGHTVQGLVVKDHFWTDMGTPADYLNLHAALLTGKNLKTAESVTGNPFFISSDAIMGSEVGLNDWVSIGADAKVGKGATLTRVVVWDGAEVAPGAVLSDTIVV
ncbi:MAG: sugar phosphate nucleotidyltransferase [Thermodesulfobacteriota bacterium]|nr:sugar phosphate nucleotidyltransferase [Thermodesulfobacteriota bacterium]